MAQDINKHLDRARKSLEKNKLREAVSEYQAVLEEAPAHQEALQALADIFTRLNEPQLAAEYYGIQFDRLVETALRCPAANIEIAGHTDADGEDGFNQMLSEKRAQAVADYLVKAGLPASQFTATGYGSTQPVASNDTDEGKAQNRRIDFLVR